MILYSLQKHECVYIYHIDDIEIQINIYYHVKLAKLTIKERQHIWLHVTRK